MPRYLRTLRLFWGASLAAEMEYRSNFVFAAISSTFSLGGAMFVLWGLMRSGYEPGGWGFYQALAVVGIYTILDGFSQTLLSPNRQQVTEMVREGTLDFVLIKPIDAQFWLSLRKLSIWGVPNLFLGVGLTIFAGLKAEPQATALGFLAVIPTIVIGLTILYAMGYVLSTFTIWFTKLYNITIAMQSLLEAGRYPIPAYPHSYRVFFTFVLPVAFMTTVPAQSLLGEAKAIWLIASLGTAIIALIIARRFWLFALRFYTSASS